MGYLVSGSTLLFVSVLLCLSRVLYSIWWKPRQLQKFFKDQGVVGPPYKLLYGSLKDNAALIQEALSKPMEFSHKILPRISPFIHHTVETYGKVSLIWQGTQPRVIILDPEMIKEILSSKFDQFQKPISNPVTKLLATGLLDCTGEKWAKHRKILNPAFHLEKIKGMLPDFHTSCMELICKWDNLAGTQEGSCEVDVWHEFQNLTGDVISRSAFGSNYSEGSPIFKLQSELAKLVAKAISSPYFPGLQYLPTKDNLRRKKISNEMSAFISSIIEKKEKAMKLGKAPQGDLLSLLLKSNLKEFQKGGSSKAITTKEVIEECKSFYFAGHVTTLILLTWTMVLLSMHPLWQNCARDEVLQIFGKNKPEFDDLSHLKIVNMILHEVLRLYPPVILLVRTTYKEVRVGKVTFPPGVELALPALFLHHDKELWGEDAEEFNPERFIGGVSKAAKYQTSFIPFGWGPRTCLGQNFALIEAKLALSMILQQFSFELSPFYVHAPSSVLTLQPQYGAQVILHKL
ncbi:cytochrome P450 CYP72A616-like [Aristolochia californica]|uniref:cytochrome P450 CYP72A616-like n=1 Tax=Aristolochia californica TaxID=171875 RepID=UPI0035E05E8D